MDVGTIDIFKKHGKMCQRWSILDLNSILTLGNYGDLDCLVTFKSWFYNTILTQKPLWSYLGILRYYKDASCCFGLRLHLILSVT